ncbi:LysM peptidoglycan-binding domain-containing protein [Cyclobacterium jeungdonense]|uniref:LysM peptidoglycan-binding domain-containing protein n=1 Tax=Cyclobacterium jeungdonense TaxID=708087 RepID=A0ABT8C403_9BACT|nr:LysM peptidoglycan-binding domain-containing protein [Cyclobacterium jeungdonense]MDN3686476.1 LysM peptidoglycan-binding domain-containing protein [Cyclobacterium jeungdonense]
MKTTFFFGFLFTISSFSIAIGQVPQVPQTIYFAGMTLRLNGALQNEIQAEVNAQYRSPSHFQTKLDRVNLYLPIVDRVLREEGVPTDFKYLVIQESSLISDAVSTSNAVGFWQFKQGTAEEVSLRVDREIDERKNIVSSTRGAATYLKKHQKYLDNWAITLVSYQMGLGGANNYFKGRYKGQREMDLDRKTYWYLKKFLAHKIAYEGQMGKTVSNGDYLHEYPVKGPTDLKAVAKRLGVSESHLRNYNKWASRGKIPGDRTYVITYILNGIVPERPVLVSNPPVATDDGLVPLRKNARGFPKVSGNTANASQPREIEINGIKGILATSSSQRQLASQAGISERKLRRSNDLKPTDPVQAGRYYYTRRKKSKGEPAEHVVQVGETLWGISQLYGIRLHSLMAKNRVYRDEQLMPGMVLRLRKYYKRNETVARVKLTPANRQATTPPPVQKKESQTTPIAPPTSRKEIKVPIQEPTPRVLEHLVEPGDTLYAISRKYGVTVDELKVWNQIGQDNVLSVGQKLEIKK